MKIPYGMSNFADLRREGYFYADKTRFLSELESAESGYRHLLFLRPRRFGKSTLVSMLEHYYDIARADEFDELFQGLYVHQHPTPLKNRFLVLTLDFAPVDPSRGLEYLRETFYHVVRFQVDVFLQRYRALVPAYADLLGRLDSLRDPVSLMMAVFAATASSRHRIYLLIDEYDSFANKLLAQPDQALYHEIFEGTGFVRSFYETIKHGTRPGMLSRSFITGVSPVAIADMASGFNITAKVSLDPRLSGLCGLSVDEVTQAIAQFTRDAPELAQPDELLAYLKDSYNGYGFTQEAEERYFNTDMVLYFLMQLHRLRRYPRTLLDENVRIDYGKLRQVATPPGGRQDWHLELLQTILLQGRVQSEVSIGFGARERFERQHLLSLLFYLGLLSSGGVYQGGPWLEVPNRVIRLMHWEEMSWIWREQAGAIVDTTLLQGAVSKMAYEGNLAPFLNLVQDGVLQVLSNRDLMNFDEKHLKLVLLTYLSLSSIYRILSEKEFAQGYGDLFLGLDRRFPDARFSYLLELKHVKTHATMDEIAAARAEADEQLERYLSDVSLLPLLGNRTVKAVAVVFVGAKEHRVFELRAVPPPTH